MARRVIVMNGATNGRLIARDMSAVQEDARRRPIAATGFAILTKILPHALMIALRHVQIQMAGLIIRHKVLQLEFTRAAFLQCISFGEPVISNLAFSNLMGLATPSIMTIVPTMCRQTKVFAGQTGDYILHQ